MKHKSKGKRFESSLWDGVYVSDHALLLVSAEQYYVSNVARKYRIVEATLGKILIAA
jgi:hypothetical protein